VYYIGVNNIQGAKNMKNLPKNSRNNKKKAVAKKVVAKQILDTKYLLKVLVNATQSIMDNIPGDLSKCERKELMKKLKIFFNELSLTEKLEMCVLELQHAKIQMENTKKNLDKLSKDKKHADIKEFLAMCAKLYKSIHKRCE
jgi:chorismate mutase